jgi:chemosensory pili system protein ChpA (sensor histidine kinase/response regulator)
MTYFAQFNALPLLSVKPALDSALDKVGSTLEQYFASNGGDKDSLDEATNELHRASGVLRMLSLEGVIVFCSELEKLLNDFSDGSLQPTSLHHEVVQRALLILTHYLNSLAEGAPNAALRLFDPYQELLQARGIETAFEVDLFFPELNVELPSAVLDIPQTADAITGIKAARGQYQLSLLKWLRQDNAGDALQTMRSAVQSVLSCMPQNRRRAFWWVAAGLLDCLIYDGLPPELNAKKLLGRIDLQMKANAEGAENDDRTTLIEMLYLVARSHAVSDTVDAIKRCYALDTYLPEEPPLPPGEIAQVLGQLRTQLNEAEETWEKCLQDATLCKSLAAQAEQLYTLSERLDRNTLQLLCKQIHTAVVLAEDAEYRQHAAINLAMALILLDDGIAHYAHLGDDFHEQARIVGQRLQAGAAEPTEDHESGQLVQLHCRMAQREIIPLLSTAMSGNLEQVEQELNAFFSDPAKREELARLARQLNQVHGSLIMLSLGQAAQLVDNVKSAVERYTEGGTPPITEMRMIATAISALDAYVHDLTFGQKPDDTPLERLLLETGAAPAAAPVPAAAAAATASAAVAVPMAAPEDNEMLEVFLEEAQEVLGILRTNLDLSQLHPDSNEPLVTIRRGFHTLKGSGRMVGLNDFGEVAWAVERAMNKWLQENKPATPGLLQFIADAEVVFRAWIDALLSRSGSAPDAAPLVAAAQLIENGQEPEAAAETPSLTLPPVPEASVPETEVPEQQSQARPAKELSLESFALGPAEEAPPAPAELAIADLQESAPPAAPATGMEETPSEEFSFESLALPATQETEEPELSMEAGFDIPGLPEAASPAPGVEAGEELSFESPVLPAMEEPQAAEPSMEVEEFTLPDFQEAVSESAAAKEPEPAPPEEITLESFALPSLEEMQPAEAGFAEEFVVPEFHESASQSVAPAGPEIPEISQVPETLAEPESDSDTVTVGTKTLSASLFDIATEECASHLSSLNSGFADLRVSNPPAVSYDFMRAAHTLGGVNRTMGFTDVADLSRALELWIEARIGKSFTLTDAQADLIEQTIAMLDAMFLDICNRQEPQPQPDLIRRLQADQEFFIAGEAEVAAQPAAKPPQETPVTAKEALPEQEPTKVVWGASTTPAPEQNAEAKPEPAALEPAIPEAEPGHRVRRYVEERVVQDEIDEQLLPIFLEESNDLQPQIGNSLRAWRDNPENAKPASELQRTLHTLKGSARMAGAMRLGELVHRMEDRAVAAMKGRRDGALWDELDNYADRISHALERLRSGGAEMETAAPVEEAQAPAQQAPAAETRAPAPAAAEVAPPTAETPAERATAMLRVRSDTVDRLVNEAGEISVARSRIDAELRSFKTALTDMSDSVLRLRKQLREIEIQAESQLEARVALAKDMAEKFDPLEFDRFTRFQELTRFMGESVHDVQTVQQTLLKNLDEIASAMSAQAYLNRDLQQSLMAIRMVPFSSIANRLYRIVRQTSKELNKRANLDIQGGETELDRSVLDRMTAPFEHLLRNAIAHGLESQEERAREGKEALGQVQVSLAQEGNEVVFTVSDDGVGINLNRLRLKAQEVGLVQPGTTISDEDAMLLIFNAGISTATEVTEISGRGVGMDVVRNEIVALGGQISVHSERGKGSRFTIRLPLTLAVAQILMARAGPEYYAIPSVMVEQVLHVKPDALENAYHSGHVEWQGRSYPLRYLPRLLGNEEQQIESRMHNPVLLLRSGDQRMALHVDELLGNQETVVKNIGPQLARLPGVAGATVLGSGRVVLILNPIALIQRIVVTSKAAAVSPAEPVERVAEAEPRAIPVVMVVDDSLTVRKVTSRMLTRAGYEVVTAKDGVDALEQLTQITPAVMLLDVEMPRMDGFELTKQIRRDPKLRDLPILMITSRTAEKHRDYALELGVNAYFGKPFQEEELLQQISAFASPG